jgi:hypothetical protein
MDSDKIKNFVLYNFEKAIVLAVIGISGFLIYSGSQKPDITKKHDPEQLVSRASEVKRQVDDDHTEAVMAERRETFAINIAEKLAEYRNPIPADSYRAQATWDMSKTVTEKVRRQDPELFKPVGVQATGVIASMAYRSTDGSYTLAGLEPADELEKVEQKPRRTRRSRRRNSESAEMMGGGEMMMGGEMAGMEMEMGEGMEMDMMMDEMGAMDGATSGAVRKLAADQTNGFKPAPTRSLRNGEQEPPVPGIGLFIAGTAAIPHKDLIESYRKALSYAPGYNPSQRDLPLYVAYQVQRADVTDKSIDELDEDDWVLRDYNTKTIRNAALYWSGFAPEVVPADYWINGVTMWIPPILLDPYKDFAVNPLVPLKSQRQLEQERMLRQSEQPEDSSPLDPDRFEVDIAGGQRRSYGGMGGEGMMMDSMEMGMGEMGMGEMGMGEMGMGEMGMGEMGMGGMTGMTGKPAETNPVDFKLLRFYDFAYLRGAPREPDAPKRNRKYVYRIRFAINDPNFPEDPMLQPQGKTLDAEAYERFISLTADAKKNNQRNFRRWSDWSDISEPVSLPPFDRSYVGPVKSEKAKRVKAGNRRILVENTSPTAEVVSSSFDVRLGAFVPARMTASEGTVLSKKVETADVVDPITLEVKKVTDKTIDSSATVIDIEGGVPLEIVEDEEMSEPGVFLMVDSQGKLIVKESTEQQREYRIRSFAEERGL